MDEVVIDATGKYFSKEQDSLSGSNHAGGNEFFIAC